MACHGESLDRNNKKMFGKWHKLYTMLQYHYNTKEETMLKDKRRKKIVDLKTQSLVAIEVMLHALIAPLLLIIFLSIAPFSTFLSKYTAEQHFNSMTDLFNMNASKWPLLVLILLFIGFLSIIFSHHIAGPSLRFRKEFKRIAKKDLTGKVTLRKFDYLKDLSQDYNSMLSSLSSELKTIQGEAEAIIKTAEASAEASNLDKIKENSLKIKSITESYKLG